MHLADRCSRERLGIERRVDVGDLPPKFTANYALNVRIRKRCDIVEESEEFVAVSRGKKVKPQCKGLAELYPRRTELLEREAQPDRSRYPATSREPEFRENTVPEDSRQSLD